MILLTWMRQVDSVQIMLMRQTQPLPQQPQLQKQSLDLSFKTNTPPLALPSAMAIVTCIQLLVASTQVQDRYVKQHRHPHLKRKPLYYDHVVYPSIQ